MKAIKVLLMIAVGIALAYGGIQWTIFTTKIYGTVPEIIVGEDFNLTMRTGQVYNYSLLFPAIMGIVGGITWICFSGLASENFAAAVNFAAGIMLIPIGVLNFLRGIFIFESGHMMRDRNIYAFYPSPILRFLFIDHHKISIFIFAGAALVLCGIGYAFLSTDKKKEVKENPWAVIQK